MEENHEGADSKEIDRSDVVQRVTFKVSHFEKYAYLLSCRELDKETDTTLISVHLI